jgi:hypothetical protein
MGSCPRARPLDEISSGKSEAENLPFLICSINVCKPQYPSSERTTHDENTGRATILARLQALISFMLLFDLLLVVSESP